MRNQRPRLLTCALVVSLLAPANLQPAVAKPFGTRHPGAATERMSNTAVSPTGDSAATLTASQARVKQSLSALPLYFVENKGQADSRVAFYIQGSDKTIYFTPQGVTFALTAPVSPTTSLAAGPTGPTTSRLADRLPFGKQPATAQQRWAVKLDFVGANPNVRPVGESKTDAVFSYFKGQPSQWQVGLRTYAQIRYPDLWPGIDLVYSGQVNQLKYEFVVRPGADPSQIQLAYRGASAVRLTAEGQLEVTTPLGGFRDAAPVAYQVKDGRRVPVEMAYALTPNLSAGAEARYPYRFHLGPYDASQPLVLDPAVLVYAGYIGGAGDDQALGIAVDSAGNVYVTGYTASDQTTFPAAGGPDLTYIGGIYGEAFVAKVNAAGTALVYAGYIGGAGGDYGNSIAVDSAGNAYVTGVTRSDQTTFPVTVGPDLTYNGFGDAFVAKVNAAGTALVYAGYIGGASYDAGTGIAVDGAGNAYITGETSSDQITFPAAGGPDLTYNGVQDAFVAKVNAAGTALVYAGYIGGAGDDGALGIAVDGAGNAYVTGRTTSDQTTFPAAGGPDLTYNGVQDAFVAKVNAAGTALVYAGYIGGVGDDAGYGIAVDGAGNAYITGYTRSDQTTFPVTVGPDLTYNGGFNGYSDAFVAKVNSAGTALVYAGYIGGASYDYGNAIAVDGAGNAYVTGWTASDQATFPVTVGPDLTYNGSSDAFVAKVNAAGTALVYAGYIGGASLDYGVGITVDSSGNAYVTGGTYSDQTTFPVTVGPDLTYNGGDDAFVAKVSEAATTDFGKTAIVFVHGWSGFPPWGECNWPNPDSYFQSVDDDMRAAGYYVGYAALETSPCYTPPLADNVWRLRNAISLAKAATGQPQVILIAHSMGGLVSRAYIEGPDYAGDVKELFTFGSPHLGVPSDLATFFANGISLGTYCENYQPAVCDFSVAGMTLFNQDHQQNRAVTYHVISGDAPFLARSAQGQLMDALFFGTANDGIVPTASGTGLVGTMDRWTTDEVHATIFGSRSYFIRDGGQSTSYQQCLKKVLIDNNDATGTVCGAISSLAVARQQASPALIEHTPVEYSTLLMGQTHTHTLSLEGGAILFATQWETGTFSVNLRSPSNQVIDPAFAAANPTVVSYTADANAATYYFPNADAGAWQVVLQASSVPVSGTSYSTFAAFDSSVALAGGVDKLWYAPGATANITATLSGSPVGAVVTATVLPTNGVTTTVTLSPVGAGQYQATYLVPNTPGYTEVLLAATGTLTGGLAFERGESLLFQISPNSAALNGTYSEAVQPYPAFPALHQALTVTVGVNSAVNGTFGLSADLVDAGGNLVAHGLTIQGVVTGANSLALRFDGADIFASQRNGPYTLTNLLLTDETSMTLAVAEAQNTYTTAGYTYSSFASPQSIYLPLIRR